jgi:hypothetical protein
MATTGKWIFGVNILMTAYLTGLIWTIQVVHYPLFAKVGKENFITYLTDHNLLITYVVMLPMIIELAVSGWLLLQRPPQIPFWVAVSGFSLTCLIWLATFFVACTYHAELFAKGYNLEVINNLVNANWIRTIAWTLHLGLLVYGFILILKPTPSKISNELTPQASL